VIDGKERLLEHDTPEKASDNVITGPEAEAQLRYVERALKAGSKDEREAALADGLLTFGARFVMLWIMLGKETGAWSGFVHETGPEVLILFAAWLKGKQLSARADEPERRALAALPLGLDVAPPFPLAALPRAALLEPEGLVAVHNQRIGE
jgi:hypothetical protein